MNLLKNQALELACATLSSNADVWRLQDARPRSVSSSRARHLDRQTAYLSGLRAIQTARASGKAKFRGAAQSRAEILGVHRGGRRGFRDRPLAGLSALASRHDYRCIELSRYSERARLFR